MRGWKVGGVGPRDGLDGLGGDLAWALGLSVFAPVPKKEHWPLKLHGFLNVGKVVGYRRGELEPELETTSLADAQIPAGQKTSRACTATQTSVWGWG
jgi:hypothetical protein